MKTSFWSVTWAVLVLLVCLGSIDTAWGETATAQVVTTPAKLSFCVASNSSPAPAPQTLTVNSSGQEFQFNANGFPSWVVVTPTHGDTQTNNQLTVSIDPSAYATISGANGAVQIVGQNGAGLNVPVSITVDPNCAALSASPDPVIFPSVAVGTTGAQIVQVTITGPAAKISSIDQGNGPSGVAWLSATLPGGSQVMQVTVDPSSLAANTTYTGHIIIAAVDGSQSPITVPVSIAIGASAPTQFAANPPSWTLTLAAGTTTEQPKTVDITGATMQVNATANQVNGPSGWLAVSPTTILAPDLLTITVFPGLLSPGNVYNGSITITPVSGGGSPLQIPVQVTMGTTSYSLNPNPLNLTVTAGSTTLKSQNVYLSGPTTSGLQITATSAPTSPAGWLIAPSGTGSPNQNYSISVNPANMVAGQSYSGTVTFSQGGNVVATLQVNVTTITNQTISVSPPQLSFLYQTGQSAPAPQNILVTSPAGTSITFTPSVSYTSCGTGWLVVSPSSAVGTTGTTPVAVNVSISTSSLAAGNNCSANVNISAPGGNPSSLSVPVNLQVSNGPLLLLSPTSLSFNYTPGVGLPHSQQVSVKTTDNSAINFTYTVNPALSGGPEFLTVTPTSFTTPATLTIGIDSSAVALLAAGTYTDNIVFTSSAAGNSPVTVAVTLTVTAQATFVANPSALSLNWQIGQTAPPNPSITLSSTGGPLQFNASTTSSTCGNFLSVSPTSGSTLTASGQNGTPLQVSIAGVTGQTSPTTCQGDILISSPSSTASLDIKVTVNVVNTAVINLGLTNITQTAPIGSTSAVTIQLPVTASDGATAINFNATATTNPAGLTWLTVTPQQGGTTPSNVKVKLDPTGLNGGTYTGTVTITDTRNNSAVPTQTLPVTFTIAAQAAVDKTSLTFNANEGGAEPPNQTINVTGIPSGATISATASTQTCGASWLSATVSGGVVTVAADNTGLKHTQSPCTGPVSIVVPGASNSPLNVPVTFTIGPAITMTVAPKTLTFNYVSGSTAVPATQTVQLTATNNAVIPFTTTASTQTGGNWLTVSPASGTTGSNPTTLTIGVDTTKLTTPGAATYTGTVTVASTSVPNGSVTVSVTLAVAQAPPPAVMSIDNAATQQPGPVAPGEIVSLYGTNIGPDKGVVFTLSNNTVPTTLGDTQVMFDNTPAPILYAGPNQLNVIVPYEVAGRVQTNVTVVRDGMTSSIIQQVVAATAPGIFTQDASGKGAGSVLNQDYSVNKSGNPAPAGSVIAIYATGEGQLNPGGVTGSVTSGTPPFPKPVAGVTVNFMVQQPNGNTTLIPATVVYAGEAPTLVSGVLQVNVIVPSTVPSGAQKVILTVGNNSSPSTVTVAVQ